jgi:FkbM family methyltransferase
MKVMRKISEAIGGAVPDGLYYFATNLRCKLRGYRLNLGEGNLEGTHLAQSGDETILIARRNRHRYYKRGVQARLDQLAGQYCLDGVSFSKGDKIIDCGANIGEIGVWAKRFGVEYIPFEPEDLEATCCDANAFEGEAKTQRLALWYEDTELTFYSKPDTADGSLIEINDFNAVRKVKAVRFDNFIKQFDDDSIRLFKVEAEGAEPEVLQGAEPMLSKVDYVTVDSGFERGKSKQSTFNEVNEILTRNNFEIVSANLERLIFLFKRRDCKD